MKSTTLKSYIVFVLLLVLGSSCSYKNRNILFKTSKQLKGKEAVNVFNADSIRTIDSEYKHRIKIGDRLLIRFLNNYDLGQASMQSATSAANTQMSGSGTEGYLVNYDSTVTLPLVGRINLVGLSRLDAAKKLEEVYSKHINEPIIDLNIANLSVSVLGEVNNPGKIFVDKENTTIVDVIALAGGFKDAGKKNRIQIIRPNEIIIVDMKDIGATFNPKTIIHDNDIIYVQPYGIKAGLEPVTTTGVALAPILTAAQLILMSVQIYIMWNRN